MPTNTVTIYTIWVPDALSRLDEWSSYLSAAELDRAGRFYAEFDRQRFVVSYGSLRFVLGAYLDISPKKIEFTQNEYGKPYLRNQGLYFNLSHSQDVVLIAISKSAEVGVDVEKINRDVDYLPLAERFFSEQEIKELNQVAEVASSELPQVFFNIWTRKEALIKALGRGLSYRLSSFSVNGGIFENPRILGIEDLREAASGWQLKAFSPADGYTAAVVSQGDFDLLINTVR